MDSKDPHQPASTPLEDSSINSLSPTLDDLIMLSKVFVSLAVLAASVIAAAPQVSKRATCSNGQTTADASVNSAFVTLTDGRC